MQDCIFCKIIKGEIPSRCVYEDEICYAFEDIEPLAPMHFLIVPKVHVSSAAEIDEALAPVVGHIYVVVAQIAREKGFAEGYRVVTNCGTDAGQTVSHLHFHVLAGRKLGSFN